MGEIDRPLNVDWEPDTQMIIKIVCNEVMEMLLEKNRCYGDSAINPARIFSKSSAIEQINVRIDDKINRLMNGSEYGNEDTEKDLIGYLILKRVAQRRIQYDEEQQDQVLENVGWKSPHSQRDDWVCGCGRDGCVDGKDKEYAPTIRTNVFRDIVAKP
ncbi:MAG: hypothetical protein ACYSW3_25975 [Planctomycetota bacterium]|jgi:hypothetical protein